MATNCDNGHGGGGGDCGLGKGEGGPKAYNAGAGPDVVAAGTELLSFKYFTGGQNATKCLLYDPLHDNSIGLPPALTSYDVGGPSGCTHQTEMLVAIATVAYQTVFAARKQWDDLDGKTRRPAFIDTCHALASDSPVVKQNWPAFFTGK
jgi:hypothetical protein